MNVIIPFDMSFASHKKSYCWSDKNLLKPENVFRHTNKKFLFNCDKCNHEINTNLNSIISNDKIKCAYCGNKTLCSNDECNTCFNKSFASSDKAIYWSDDNIIKPRNVFKSSNKKYIFNCIDCNHIINKELNGITSGSWCPYCSVTCLKLCENDDCMFCFNRSFASSDKAIYWSKNNALSARQVTKSSEKKCEFLCKCGHSFISPLYSITGGKNWCKYCAGQELCLKEDCTQCFEKSFASNEKSKYWSNKNIKKPREVFKSANHKYLFNCNKCNKEFNTTLNHISSGKWCPYCINKTEQKLFDEIIKYYVNIKQQCRFDWCKTINTNKYCPYDFVIEEYKIIIELDGIQHFKQVSNWDSPEDTQIRDKYKMEQANKNGYSVIRILQEDVYFDKYDWVKELKDVIEKIKFNISNSNNDNDNKIENIFLCKKNEYNIFDKYFLKLSI